jgi:hypothetical protein
VHEDEPLVPEALATSPGRATAILFRTLGAVIILTAVVAGLAAWRHSGATRPHVAAAEAAPAVVHAKPKATPKPAALPVTDPQPRPTFTVIRATRDRSWLSIRVGGPNGQELFRGTLQRGQALKYGLSKKLWVRMGRPLALDIRIGKTPVGNLPNAASNVLLTRNGAR